MKMSEVKTVVDSKRGCGWRKPGGLYLRCDGVMVPCGKLPVPLGVCPCCSAGIKPARGWTWFNPQPFLKAKACNLRNAGESMSEEDPCDLCPMETAPERAGLLWVGEKFYPTPQAYMAEAGKLGVSRRINRVPQGYKPGDRVYLAHRLCISENCPNPPGCTEDCPKCKGEGKVYTAGIFTTFVPDRIEYVTKGDETEEDLDALAERGITPVKVVHDEDLTAEQKQAMRAESECLEIEGGQE